MLTGGVTKMWAPGDSSWLEPQSGVCEATSSGLFFVFFLSFLKQLRWMEDTVGVPSCRPGC